MRFLVFQPGLAPFIMWAEDPDQAVAQARDWLGLEPDDSPTMTATRYLPEQENDHAANR